MKRDPSIIFLLIVFFIVLVHPLGMTMDVPNELLFSVVYIANLSTGKAGTGFLVYRTIGKDSGKVFLVSNKHVLLPSVLKTASQDNKEAKAIITLNRLEDGKIKIYNLEIKLRDNNGVVYVRSHPLDMIDVAAIDFTPYISNSRGDLREDLKIRFIQEERFATKAEIEKQFITVGADVLVLGYPLNLVEGGHCIPIGRSGIIASHPAYDFKDQSIILIDSTIVRGSSGSPVILPMLLYKKESDTERNAFTMTQPMLLGIIKGSLFDWGIEIKKTIAIGQEQETILGIDAGNIGIVYRVETIIETINEFGYPRWQPVVEEKSQK
jgi:hypothetical protein